MLLMTSRRVSLFLERSCSLVSFASAAKPVPAEELASTASPGSSPSSTSAVSSPVRVKAGNIPVLELQLLQTGLGVEILRGDILRGGRLLPSAPSPPCLFTLAQSSLLPGIVQSTRPPQS